MKLTRRRILGHAIAVGGLGLIARPSWARTTLDLGALRLDTLSDGQLTLPREFITAPMPDEAADLLAEFGITGDTLMPDCNLTLLRDGTHVVLFDAGSGPNFMPSAGKIGDALNAIGLDPAEVTHVVFTHGHPDHLWGVLDDFDEPLFLNATHMMGAAEHAYWSDPDTVNTIGTARQAFAAGARRMLDTLGDAMALFDDSDEILPGITARMSPGHTPGHMSFVVTAGSEPVTIIGDAIGNAHLAFARPEWPSGSDQDQPRAAETRKALLADLAANGQMMVGFHFPSPGIGRAVQRGEGFAFIPEPE